MKKKGLTTLLALTCVLSLTACSADAKTLLSLNGNSGKNDETAEVTTVTEETVETEETIATEGTVSTEETEETDSTVTGSKPATNLPTELSDDLYDFQISINGTVYQFPMWYSDFEALGWNYTGDATQTLSSNQYTVAETWKKDGYSIYTKIANLSMNSAAYSDCIIAGITFDTYYFDDCDWEILLPKGIQYGVSNKDDIIAAYGDPSYEYDGDLYTSLSYEYDTYNSIELYVYKDTNTLRQIELENIVELEGGNNEVNAEVPDIVKKYSAPASLGDDLYAFNVELEGALYTLPCPVSELLANGFTIKKNSSAEAIAAGSFDWIELQYNNQSYRTIVHNYADYATIPENCFVTSLRTSEYGPDYDMVIPCNIKRGDSEETLLNILKDFNYETDNSNDFTYYEVYDPNGSSLDSFEITVHEGVISQIDVSNGD